MLTASCICSSAIFNAPMLSHLSCCPITFSCPKGPFSLFSHLTFSFCCDSYTRTKFLHSFHIKQPSDFDQANHKPWVKHNWNITSASLAQNLSVGFFLLFHRHDNCAICHNKKWTRLDKDNKLPSILINILFRKCFWGYFDLKETKKNLPYYFFLLC